MAANEKLKKARKQKRWSMERASEMVGVSKSTYLRWETGHQKPHPTTLDLLCQAFEMTPEALGFDEPTQAESPLVVRTEATRVLVQADRSLQEPVQPQIRETPEQILTTSLTPLRLTEDQLIAFASLLRLGDTMMFDPTKRRTLETLLATLNMAMVTTQGFLPSEVVKHMLEPETDLARINEMTIQGYAKLMEACWQLSRGNELALAEKLLPECMTKLVPLAQRSSKYKQAVANLVAQGFRLYGILALHRNDLQARNIYCNQAVQYSKVSEDRSLLISSLKGLAQSYHDSNQHLQAIKTYLDSLQYGKSASPLLKARLYMGLAASYAYIDQQQDSLNYLGLALDTFPDHPETDPGFRYTDCDSWMMILLEGMIRSKLGQTNQALDTFKRIEQPTTGVPERVRIEILNQNAKTAIFAGDLEQGLSYIEAGVIGAKILGSQKRYNEAYDNYRQMTLLWPMEKRVKELGELFYT
jgi:transcriptional regulator with XRE-family HTH domain